MSETKGRCRQRLEEAYSGNKNFVPPYAWITADAIDRIAADVAEIKEAAVPARAMSDVFEQHLAAANREREEAIREREEAIRTRGEAWDEVRRVKTELAERPWPVGWMVEVERLKGRTAEAIKERDAAIRERDEARAEVERLRAELAARPAANSPGILDGSPEPRGWLTEEEKARLGAIAASATKLGYMAAAEKIRAIIARDGSSPVVEVPAMPYRQPNFYSRQEAECYRAALDKAGVAWKEVPRE